MLEVDKIIYLGPWNREGVTLGTLSLSSLGEIRRRNGSGEAVRRSGVHDFIQLVC